MNIITIIYLAIGLVLGLGYWVPHARHCKDIFVGCKMKMEFAVLCVILALTWPIYLGSMLYVFIRAHIYYKEL